MKRQWLLDTSGQEEGNHMHVEKMLNCIISMHFCMNYLLRTGENELYNLISKQVNRNQTRLKRSIRSLGSERPGDLWYQCFTTIAWNDWKYWYFSRDGMLVYRRVTLYNCACPSILFLGCPQQSTGTHSCFWVEKGIVRVKCFDKANELNVCALNSRSQQVREGQKNHYLGSGCGHGFATSCIIMNA